MPDPALTEKLARIQERMAALGYPVVVTGSDRTPEEQQRLYAQGRSAPGPVVTQTQQSRHMSGQAADLAFSVGGKPSYAENLPWAMLGKVAKEEGLEWGGDWKSLVDRPHVQLPGVGSTMPQQKTTGAGDYDAEVQAAQQAYDAEVAQATQQTGTAPPGVLGQLGEAAKQTVKIPFEAVASIPGQVMDPYGTIVQAAQSNEKLFNKAAEAFKKGDYGDASVKGLWYLLNGIPGLGATMDEAGEAAQRGEYGKAAGMGVGTGLTMAAPALMKGPTERLAGKMNERADVRVAKAADTRLGATQSDLMKVAPPTQTAAYTPTDMRRILPYVSEQNRVKPITTVEEWRDAMDTSVSGIETRVKGYIDRYPNDIIRSDPYGSAKLALQRGARETDVSIGLKELDDLGLDKPVSLTKAEQIRLRLNAENKAVLKKNNYDVATAMKSDPAYLAREVAVRELRSGIYNQLAERGIEGVDVLRRDEGAMLSVRNAVNRQIFSGEKGAPGTSTTSLPAKITRAATPALGAGIGGGVGAVVGGWPGGVAGAALGTTVGETAARHIFPTGLTRDALVTRALKNFDIGVPRYPEVTTQGPAALLPSHPIESVVPDTSRVASVQAVPPDLTPQRRLPAYEPGRPMPSPERLALPPPADTSSVTAVPAPPQRARLQLPAGEGTRMPATPDVSGVTGQAPKQVIVKDPKTGQIKVVYTGEPASLATMTPVASHEVLPPVPKAVQAAVADTVQRIVDTTPAAATNSERMGAALRAEANKLEAQGGSKETRAQSHALADALRAKADRLERSKKGAK